MKNIELLKKQMEQLKVSGRHPLYRNVMYWSKKPPEYIGHLINYLTTENNIVLDPFAGSGSTIIEAIRNNRKGIRVDINEWPIEIIRNLGKNIDFVELDSEFNFFIEEIKRAAGKYYSTKCNKCNAENGIMEKVVFNRGNNIIEAGTIYYYCFSCKKKYKRLITQEDKAKMQKSIKNAHVGGDLIENSRTAVVKGLKASSLYTQRNLSVNTIIKTSIEKSKSKYKEIFNFLFGSILHLTKLTDTKSQSQFPFWLPKEGLLERNIIFLFEKKYNMFKKSASFRPKKYSEALSFSDMNSKGKNILLLQKPAQTITSYDIPDNSIDLIITDPPYFDQVPYSEYLLFWKHWIGKNVGIEEEVIVSNGQNRNKDEKKYMKDLKDIFFLLNKKLKKGKFLCLFFHDANIKNWNEIFTCVLNNGFRYEDVIHLPKKKSSYKNINTPLKSLNGDAVLLFTKNRYIEKKTSNSIQFIEEDLKNEIIKYMTNIKDITTSEIYDKVLLPSLLRKNTLEKLSKNNNDLIALIKDVCNYSENIGKWELKR
jgi:DNA modification methylase